MLPMNRAHPLQLMRPHHSSPLHLPTSKQRQKATSSLELTDTRRKHCCSRPTHAGSKSRRNSRAPGLWALPPSCPPVLPPPPFPLPLPYSFLVSCRHRRVCFQTANLEKIMFQDDVNLQKGLSQFLFARGLLFAWCGAQRGFILSHIRPPPKQRTLEASF